MNIFGDVTSQEVSAHCSVKKNNLWLKNLVLVLDIVLLIFYCDCLKCSVNNNFKMFHLTRPNMVTIETKCRKVKPLDEMLSSYCM